MAVVNSDVQRFKNKDIEIIYEFGLWLRLLYVILVQAAYISGTIHKLNRWNSIANYYKHVNYENYGQDGAQSMFFIATY